MELEEEEEEKLREGRCSLRTDGCLSAWPDLISPYRVTPPIAPILSHALRTCAHSGASARATYSTGSCTGIGHRIVADTAGSDF